MVEMEKQSQHPIARALVEGLAEISTVELTDVVDQGDGGIAARWDEQPVCVGSPAYVARHGNRVPSELRVRREELEKSGVTVVLVCVEKTAVALAGLGDQVREDSAAAVAALGKLGWHASILSGDAQPVVDAVAKSVGIDPIDAKGQMTPEDKLTAVRHHRGNAPVIMIGDGVNDAAALAAANAGVAVHGGAEASLAAAEVYVAIPGMASVVPLFIAARRVMQTVRRNLLISLAYNLIVGILAATGRMNPLIAAILMPISSASVLFLSVASVRKIGQVRS